MLFPRSKQKTKWIAERRMMTCIMTIIFKQNECVQNLTAKINSSHYIQRKSSNWQKPQLVHHTHFPCIWSVYISPIQHRRTHTHTHTLSNSSTVENAIKWRTCKQKPFKMRNTKQNSIKSNGYLYRRSLISNNCWCLSEPKYIFTHTTSTHIHSRILILAFFMLSQNANVV